MLGPVLTIGSAIALFLLLGGKVPTSLPPVVWVPLVALGLWLLSLRVFPEKQCYVCKSSGDIGPGLLRRVCWRCGGSGRIRRVGSKRSD